MEEKGKKRLKERLCPHVLTYMVHIYKAGLLTEAYTLDYFEDGLISVVFFGSSPNYHTVYLRRGVQGQRQLSCGFWKMLALKGFMV